MDCGTEYIKMCDCEEIQKQRVKSNGDFEVRFKNGVGTVEVYHHREITAHYKPENHLWLPRQDQLQEMVKGNKHSHLLAHEFALWCHGGEEFGRIILAEDPHCDWSMEQLWLAFVMKKKYNKVWKDDKWIESATQS